MTAAGTGRRHRDHAGQARRAGQQRRRDRDRRARRRAARPARAAAASTPRCCVRRDAVQTSASVLPIRPDGSRPAFHVIGANATYTADDAPWEAIAAATHLHLGAPEFMGGEQAAKILAYAREHGVVTSADLLAPGRAGGARSATGSPRRSRYLDYLLPNDEQVLGLTGAGGSGRGCRAAGHRAASAASPPPAAPTARSSSPPPSVGGARVRDRGGRHHRLRRRVLGRLPARPGARARSRRRRRCWAVPTAALVAGGLGSDHGDFDLRAAEAFAATIDTP